MRGKVDRQDRVETLDYMRAMLGQLREMAETGEHHMLAYLIGMAYVEAADLSRSDQGSIVERKEGDQSSSLSRQPSGKIKFQ
jgi:hypothetical protein